MGFTEDLVRNQVIPAVRNLYLRSIAESNPKQARRHGDLYSALLKWLEDR